CPGSGATGGALELSDEVRRAAGEREMEIVDAAADVTRGERGFGVGVVGEVHFQLVRQRRIVNTAAAGEGVARSVEVQEQGALELVSGRNAGGGQLALAVGRELVGDDGAANGGQDVAGVLFAIFV